MGNTPKSNETKVETQEQDYVVAFMVEDADIANEYQDMLVSNNIPARVKTLDEEGASFAVMVPETYLDEAQVVVDSQPAFDDFYDLTLDDDGDFDDDYYDDEY